MGFGPPLLVGSMHKRRLLSDGGGLCSLVLWRPADRHPSPTFGAALRSCLQDSMVSFKVDSMKIAKQLAGEGLKQSPFSAPLLEDLRSRFKALAGSWWSGWVPLEEPQKANIDFRLLGSLLRGIGDPDWEIMKEYEVGVRLGVGVLIPRAAAVYAEKTKWVVSSKSDHFADDAPDRAWRDNYSSADDHSSEVEAILEEQVGKGQVLAMTEKEARQRYGAELQVASL
jgi:hypothetical protein